jgi:thioredoxin reductase
MNYLVDTLIVGAGPAGLQLGYYLERSGRDYLILERGGAPGTFFSTYPRHRQLISINKVYTGVDDPETNLRWDWNSLLSDDPAMAFGNYSRRYFPSADDLVRYLGDFARRYDLNVQYNTTVASIRKEGDLFLVTDADGRRYGCQRLVVATGFAKSYVPPFPGVELCDTYESHSTNAAEYADLRVLIVGKGNSAFETADHLTETAAVIHVVSPESVVMAWQTHYVGNLRAVNNNFLDTYQLKSQNAVIDAAIERVEHGANDRLVVRMAYSHAMGQITVREYDRVILCTGFRFDDSIFDADCRPVLTHHDKFPDQTNEWESVNVPGLYFAGTLMHACDYRKTMSGFIHGFRYNVRALGQILEHKYHGVELPCRTLAARPQEVLDLVIKRINTGSGIFLQPGFLQDLVVINEHDGTAKYYEDLPDDYIHTGPLGQNGHYYTVSLEYGRFRGDPFSIERDPDPQKGHEAPYLHPVIRRWNHNQLISEHHIQDDLENEWDAPQYVGPARAYFDAELATRPAPARLGRSV